jgi:hypothetical protein
MFSAEVIDVYFAIFSQPTVRTLGKFLINSQSQRNAEFSF